MKTASAQRKKVKKTIKRDVLGNVSIVEEVVNDKDVGKSKYIKLSGNSIFFGELNGYTRSSVLERIREEYLSPRLDAVVFPEMQFPIKTKCIIHTIPNHGGLRMVNGSVVAAKFEKWDIDNLGLVWNKQVIDALVKKNIIPDDGIKYIRNAGETEFIPIEDYGERFIEFVLYSNIKQ
jgi:hypothetical protein